MSEPLHPLIAGNWKMNGLRAALDQIEALDRKIKAVGSLEADVMIAPPATLIALATQMAQGSVIALGGQDCHKSPSGAHTGDISAQMLADSGASYVILGHSERRADHGETDALVREKTLAALEAGLAPIVCVGETLAEREAGAANQVVSTQLDGSLPEGEGPSGLVVAYEPVWAIGTGKTPSTDDIAAMHAHIRETLVARYGKTGHLVRVLYGGSVKPGNAKEILDLPNVNGALVGGASLLAEDFFAIISAA